MWIFENTEIDIPPSDAYGFVYLITNIKNGRMYVGRKFLTQAGYKQVKGKRKKIRKESDWRDYYGSSPELKADVLKYGKDSFKREILRYCKTRGETNYFETKEILERDAILDNNYYNGWLSAKISRNHVKHLTF